MLSHFNVVFLLGGFMHNLNVGDKVEIVWVHELDVFDGIKINDIAKVTEIVNDKWVVCENPEWNDKCMSMKYTQIKKVG